MSTIKFGRPWLHVIAWSIFIVYDRLFVYLFNPKLANLWTYVAVYAVNISLFYFNSHYVLPRATKGRRINYGKLIIGLVLELTVYVLLKYLSAIFFAWIKIPPFPAIEPAEAFIPKLVYRAGLFIGLSTGYWFALRTYYNRNKIDTLELRRLQDHLRNEELTKTLLVSENAYLKSQINPHFLLNTLNFLYNSVAKFSDKIADSVMTLSEMMRYALTNAGDDSKVKLEDELNHVANLIKLNQARFSERLHIEYKVGGDPDNLRIIPLVLITLVENLFKYGELHNAETPARIIAEIRDRELIFITENQKNKRAHSPSHGIGLKNINERLKMYHDFDLKIEENDHFYRSALKIRL